MFGKYWVFSEKKSYVWKWNLASIFSQIGVMQYRNSNTYWTGQDSEILRNQKQREEKN